MYCKNAVYRSLYYVQKAWPDSTDSTSGL